jgi:hypothetical protein
MASSLLAARATSISGMVLCLRPVPEDPEDPALRRLDGWTRGGSPDCFS